MNGFTPRQTVYSRRQLLRTIQRREPHHARIGALVPHSRPTASGEVTYYRGTIATECAVCPSRRDCKRTSLWLAEAETMVISGATT